MLELIKKNIFYDERGIFAPLSLESFSWVQSNISVNPKIFTLRGLHFQKQPFAQSKLIKVISGSIIDFVIDINPNSSTYLKVNIFDMDAGDELFVPNNYAHGFLTLEKNTIVQYLVDNIYNPESEGIIPWIKFPEINEKFNSIKDFIPEKIVIKERDLILKNFA
jgi:dTDP-4-dehydrorhamnose 3,5-epimerase